jgi:hypothetical protein
VSFPALCAVHLEIAGMMRGVVTCCQRRMDRRTITKEVYSPLETLMAVRGICSFFIGRARDFAIQEFGGYLEERVKNGMRKDSD